MAQPKTRSVHKSAEALQEAVTVAEALAEAKALVHELNGEFGVAATRAIREGNSLREVARATGWDHGRLSRDLKSGALAPPKNR